MTTGYVIKSDGFPHIDKDPQAITPFSVDWTAWMAQKGAVALASATVTPDAGLTKVGSSSIVGGVVTQTLSGGVAGTSYKVVFHIVVVANVLEDERTIIIDVKER